MPSLQCHWYLSESLTHICFRGKVKVFQLTENSYSRPILSWWDSISTINKTGICSDSRSQNYTVRVLRPSTAMIISVQLPLEPSPALPMAQDITAAPQVYWSLPQRCYNRTSLQLPKALPSHGPHQPRPAHGSTSQPNFGPSMMPGAGTAPVSPSCPAPDWRWDSFWLVKPLTSSPQWATSVVPGLHSQGNCSPQGTTIK